MQWEVEQKFHVSDQTAIHAKLREFGASFTEPIEQIDWYFNHPARDFAQTDEAFRLRQVGEKTTSPIKVRKSTRRPKPGAN